jgi:hypothetical protein
MLGAKSLILSWIRSPTSTPIVAVVAKATIEHAIETSKTVTPRRRAYLQGAPVEVMHPRRAGLDVHKEQVTACIRIASDGKASREVRSFSTTTSELLALAECLGNDGCNARRDGGDRRVLEAVWHILEGSFERKVPTYPS